MLQPEKPCLGPFKGPFHDCNQEVGHDHFKNLLDVEGALQRDPQGSPTQKDTGASTSKSPRLNPDLSPAAMQL